MLLWVCVVCLVCCCGGYLEIVQCVVKVGEEMNNNATVIIFVSVLYFIVLYLTFELSIDWLIGLHDEASFLTQNIR